MLVPALVRTVCRTLVYTGIGLHSAIPVRPTLLITTVSLQTVSIGTIIVPIVNLMIVSVSQIISGSSIVGVSDIGSVFLNRSSKVRPGVVPKDTVGAEGVPVLFSV